MAGEHRDRACIRLQPRGLDWMRSPGWAPLGQAGRRFDMESITGRRPLLAALTRRPTPAGRNGFLGGVALHVAVVAVDALFGNSAAIVGAFVLAPFLRSVLGTVPGTVGIGLLTAAAAVGSPAWNMDFGSTAYWIRNAEVVLGAGFAVIAARARHLARLNSQ